MPAWRPDGRPMRPWRRAWVLRALGLVALVAVVVVALAWSKPSASRVRVGPARSGGPAAPFELTDVRDPKRTIALADFKGRPVVLNFWASWCNPCQREMPAFQSVHEQLGGRVVILGIDTKDIRSDASDFLRNTGVTYRTASDPDGAVASVYGVVGLPQTFFISAQGKIVDRFIGEISGAELMATIAARFGIRS